MLCWIAGWLVPAAVILTERQNYRSTQNRYRETDCGSCKYIQLPKKYLTLLDKNV